MWFSMCSVNLARMGVKSVMIWGWMSEKSMTFKDGTMNVYKYTKTLKTDKMTPCLQNLDRKGLF